MKNKTFSSEISLEHINPEMIDIPLEVEYTTDSGFFEPILVSVEKDVEYSESGSVFRLFKGQLIPLSDTLIEKLTEEFERINNDDENYEYIPKD